MPSILSNLIRANQADLDEVGRDCARGVLADNASLVMDAPGAFQQAASLLLIEQVEKID